MKVSKFVLALSAVAGFAGVNNAYAQAGSVEFEGEIIQSNCQVSAGNNQTVNLGRPVTSTFNAAGATSSAVAFQISLAQCDPGNYTLRFAGPNPAGQPELLAVSGGADGVGIEILDNQDRVFPVAQNATADQALVAAVGAAGQATATVNLKARYKSYQDTVVAGAANATASFTIETR